MSIINYVALPRMSKKIIVTILLPVFLFACVALKPVEKLTDEELADRYDKSKREQEDCRKRKKSKS